MKRTRLLFLKHNGSNDGLGSDCPYVAPQMLTQSLRRMKQQLTQSLRRMKQQLTTEPQPALYQETILWKNIRRLFQIRQ